MPRREQPHRHPCCNCDGFAWCDGTQEQNHDGAPDVICDRYHLRNGEIAEVRCWKCDEQWRDEQEQRQVDHEAAELAACEPEH